MDSSSSDETARISPLPSTTSAARAAAGGPPGGVPPPGVGASGSAVPGTAALSRDSRQVEPAPAAVAPSGRFFLHAAVGTVQAIAGVTVRPSGRSAPPSSNSTTPLHRRLHPCPGWLATALAALRSGARASGHRGQCQHACCPACCDVPCGTFRSAIAPPIGHGAVRAAAGGGDAYVLRVGLRPVRYENQPGVASPEGARAGGILGADGGHQSDAMPVPGGQTAECRRRDGRTDGLIAPVLAIAASLAALTACAPARQTQVNAPRCRPAFAPAIGGNGRTRPATTGPSRSGTEDLRRRRELAG